MRSVSLFQLFKNAPLIARAGHIACRAMSALAAPSLATSETPKVQQPKAPLTFLVPAELALLESKVDEIWSWTPAEEILQHSVVDTSLIPLPEGNELRPLYKSPRGQPFYVRPTGWVNNVVSFTAPLVSCSVTSGEDRCCGPV